MSALNATKLYTIKMVKKQLHQNKNSLGPQNKVQALILVPRALQRLPQPPFPTPPLISPIHPLSAPSQRTTAIPKT